MEIHAKMTCEYYLADALKGRADQNSAHFFVSICTTVKSCIEMYAEIFVSCSFASRRILVSLLLTHFIWYKAMGMNYTLIYSSLNFAPIILLCTNEYYTYIVFWGYNHPSVPYFNDGINRWVFIKQQELARNVSVSNRYDSSKNISFVDHIEKILYLFIVLCLSQLGDETSQPTSVYTKDFRPGGRTVRSSVGKSQGPPGSQVLQRDDDQKVGDSVTGTEYGNLKLQMAPSVGVSKWTQCNWFRITIQNPS